MKELFMFLLKRFPYKNEASSRPVKVGIFYGTYEETYERLNYLNADPNEAGYYHTALCVSGTEMVNALTSTM